MRVISREGREIDKDLNEILAKLEGFLNSKVGNP